MKPEDYKILIRSFLDGVLTAEEFASRYDKIFLKDPGGMDKRLFDILEDLWEDVEAYSPMWSPEEENEFRITAPTLQREATDALKKLDLYLLEYSSTDANAKGDKQAR